ncbi:rhodanese-like domain-containing protein [Marimonas arenosa]|uniref:Rhodanese-like domain-containing protein n=1 Tax=Marimonas arenosa TaxID=1795305 RepID=A0AAE3W9V5_9RHOB|nr:rhodanese-like domain-containing protein [Marimonas arenosa]MDQ2089036.1 rhodanese-like domain-containing protein [Marimonas arenosa]
MFGFFMGGGVPRIAPDEAVKGAQDGSVTVIDVREMGEVAATGKATGAKHIPMMQLQWKCDPRHPEYDKSLDPEKTVVVYCATGARSMQAGTLLTRMGYKDVRNLGGLHDWVRGGGATERA